MLNCLKIFHSLFVPLSNIWVQFFLGIQGGAMNRGLLFGPPLSPLGGCERKDLQNQLGSRPSDGINVGAAVGSCHFPCSIAGRQLIAKSFARDRCFLKIWPAPAPVGVSFLR